MVRQLLPHPESVFLHQEKKERASKTHDSYAAQETSHIQESSFLLFFY